MIRKIPFLSKVSRGGKRKEDLGNLLVGVAVRLKEQQRKLDEAKRRLQERDSDLFQKVKRAYLEDDRVKASIYAQEIADIRKMIKVIYTAYLALEKVVLKLETVQTIQDVSIVLSPTLKILEGLKEQVRGIVPEVAIALESITANVNSIAIETGAMSERIPSLASHMDDQARRILDEAARSAETELRSQLPDLPQPPKELEIAQQRAVAKRPLREEDVMEYIVTHGGFLDLDEIARQYGVAKEEVINLVSNLSKQGKISIA
jgi:division protein CdvB (Snf7/Vps24/ESCRT-III family)